MESRDVPSTVVTPFTPRYSRNDTGDIAIIGNTLLTAPSGAAGDAARNGTGAQLNNNDFAMVNVDVDADAATANSSRATLNMPAGASVLFAGLYWGANSNSATRNQIRFQTPTSGAYINLTGSIIGTTGNNYHAFANVTSLVQLAGNGVYTSANVQAQIGVTDRQAGWSLVVAFRDPAAPPRNLTVFDGFVVVNTTAPSTISTTISGFTTPLTGAVNAKVGFVSYEGDLGFTGDFCQLNGTTLTDARNPANNFFNSSVSTLGVDNPGRTPSYVNQLGFDADIVNGTGIIPNGAGSATVTVGTGNEVYYPGVITTAIDIYAPVFISPKTVVDVNGGAINPGDILEYTVNVQNTGGDNATLSVLSDPIPTYTAYVPGSLEILTGANIGPKSDISGDDQAEFDAVNNRVVFRLGATANATMGGILNVGQSSQVRFRVRVADNTPNNTPIVNQATATGQGATAGLVVSSASAAASAVVSSPAAGLRLEKSVDNPRPNVGDTVTFTLTLTNQGPATANGVVVQDQLPPGFTFVSAVGTGSYNAVSGNWNVGTLINGAVATLAVTAIVASPNASTNTATITASSAIDPDPSDNSASTPVTPRRADLGIFKAIDVAAPNVGDIVTYTIAVTNFGPDDASNVVVTDSLPAGVSFVSASTLFGTYNPVTGNWSIGNLANTATAYLTIRAQVTSPGPGANTANIIGAAQYDPNPNNNTSSATLTPQLADLSITKIVDDGTPVSNQIIVFTIVVSNSGPSNATNVRVSDLLPAGLVYVSSTPSQGTFSSATNIWTVGTVNNGATASLTLRTRVVDPAPSMNRAAVSSNQYDPDPGDNQAAVAVVPETADIDVDKQVSTAAPQVGDTIAYSVRVRNRGPNDATGVLVNDLLPTGVTFVSAMPSQGSYTVGTGVWDVGNLVVGAEANLTMIVTVVTPSAIINTAIASSNQFDPVPNNNITQSIITPPQADLMVVKTVNIPTPNLDSTVTYTVTITNNGPDAATAPTVYDPLPGGLEYVSAAATAGTYDPDNGRWLLPNLPAGASQSLTLVARIVGPGAPINAATVSAAEFDPTLGNNQSSITVTPTSQVSGSVFDDLNDDGLRNVNEPGIPGVVIQLRDSLNMVVATTTTNADGVYTFPSVPLGIYSIVEQQPANYSDGKDSAGTAGGAVGNDTISVIPIAPGARLTGYTFGEHAIPPTITIGNASTPEGSLMAFTVSLSNPSGTSIVLNLTASGGTATSGTDYTPNNFQYSTDGGMTWLPGGGVNGTQVTIPAGSTAIQVRVATSADTVDEPNETFNLSGVAVSGTVAGITSGVGTIVDDDPAPTVTIGNASATEGALAVFNVTLSNPSSTALVIDLTASGGTATSGTDYTPNNFQYSTDGGMTWLPGGGVNGTQVTIPAGSTAIQVRVATTADTVDEPNETFNLSGVAVSGTVAGITSGVGTIVDDDPAPTVTIGNASATEGALAVFNATLSNPSSTALVIDLTASGGTATSGTDYTPNTFEYSTDGGMTWLPGGGVNGTQVTIPAGSAAIQVRVATTADTIDEPNETFNLSGVAVSGTVAGITSGVGTIVDDDPAPTVTIGNASATEGALAVFNVTLSNPSSTALIIDLTASGGTATSGTDYTPNNFEYSTDGGMTWLPGGGVNGTQVTIPAGSTAIQVRVATTADTVDEPNETFNLSGVAVSGTVASITSGVGTIVDDDPAPTVTIGNASATEGALAVFNLTLSNPSSTPLVIDLTASGGTATSGSDYTPNNFEYSADGGMTWLPGGGVNGTQVTIPAGSTAIQVRVATLTDATTEPVETFVLSGTSISGAVSLIVPGTGSIIDFPVSSLSGFVWEDANNNGTFDPGETPIVGATISLTGNDDLGAAVNLLATTNGLGQYSFTIARPSSPIGYTITETQPAGYFDGKDTLGTQGGLLGNDVITNIVVSSGTIGTANNFAELRPSALAGFIYIDANNNGLFEIGEAGSAGILVQLTGNDDLGIPVNRTTTTLGGGSYLFDLLRPGSYTVTEVGQPAGTFDGKSTPGTSFGGTGSTNNISGITVTAGVNGFNYNVADLPESSIGGVVFFDLNENGLQDGGEPGIAGVAIALSGIDINGASVNLVTGTAADGSYTFAGLLSGNYVISEMQPALYADGQDRAGSAGGLAGNDSIALTLPLGTAATGYTFAEIGKSIAGVVFLDRNRDCVQNSGDPGLVGLTVTLRDAMNNIVATATTQADGSYIFNDQLLGSYTVTAQLATGYLAVQPLTAAVNLTNSGISGLNFCQTLSTLQGVVYRDFNLDGNRQAGAGETGIAGIVVNLSGVDVTGASMNRSTNTAADGSFVFIDLLQGSYTLTEIQPPSPPAINGVYDGFNSPGTASGVLGPLGSNTIAAINLAAGVDALNYLFGEIPPADPFGFVYLDANNNGIRQAGEPGIAGVAVTISGTAFFGTILARPLVGSDLPGGSLTVLTDATGRYEFTPMPPGLYAITETQPPAYVDGLEENADTAGPPTVIVSNDSFSNIELAPNPIRGPFNFGELGPNSLGGSVYLDSNANGARDPGEFGVGGVTVRLTGIDSSGQPVTRTFITGTSGTYSFTGLLAGTYSLTETQPVGFDDGPDFVGTLGGVVGNDVFSNIVITSGTMGRNYNFSELVPAALVSKERLLASAQSVGAVINGLNVANLPTNPNFANAVATTKLSSTVPPRYVATGAGAGGGPHVRVFDYGAGVERFSFFAYPASFTGGVRVATGDVNGDGTPDIITAPGAGMAPLVRIFNGVDGTLLSEFNAFAPSFQGGIYVAAGDVDGNGTAEVIVGAGEGGGPHVRIFNGLAGVVIDERYVFVPGFTGGIRLATGDINLDGLSDVIVAAGPGGGPHVRVFSSSTGIILKEFFAYGAGFRGGVYVAAGDINGDGTPDIITGAGAGGGPHIRALSGINLAELAGFYAFNASYLGGVTVAARDINGDGRADIITGAATSSPSYLRLIDTNTNDDLDAFLGYSAGFRGGVFVG